MELDDINLGLAHFHGRFDVVHMRCVQSGLKGESNSRFITALASLTHFRDAVDYRKTLTDVQKCLKPGGIALVLGPELRCYDEDQNTILPMATDDNPNGSWFQRIQYGTLLLNSYLKSDDKSNLCV